MNESNQDTVRAKEEAFLFGERQSLVGILTEPAGQPLAETRATLLNTLTSPATDGVAAILLNAGILHRVGPGRMYVKIARELATLAFTTFRFDFSGIGDSKPRHDNLPFDKSSIDETQRAMDLLETQRGIRRFILIGGCSGARVSLAVANRDPRVCATIMLNFPASPGDHDDPQVNQRKDEHYYLGRAIRDSRSWRKFLAGEAHYGKIFGALAFSLRRHFREKAAPPEWLALRQSFESVARRGARLVFVCSKDDPALADLRQAGGHTLRELCSLGEAQIIVIPRSDHTFSSVSDQRRLIEALCGECLDVAARAAGHSAGAPAADLWLDSQSQCTTEPQRTDKEKCRQIASI